MKGRINVLDIESHSDLSGGGPISLLNLLKKLDREAFNPIVTCPSSGTLVNALRSIDVKTEIIRTRFGKFLYPFMSIFAIVKLFRLIEKEGVDIVHSNAACSRESFFGAIAAKIKGVPFIYHVRVLDSAGWLEKILVKLSSKIVVISDAVAEKFCSSKESGKIIKIYNGVDAGEFNPAINPAGMRSKFGIPVGTVVIGTAGELAPHKGFQYFLEAAREVVKKYSDIKFLIAGKEPKKFKGYKKQLEGLIESLELREKVILTDFSDNFPQLLAGIDIFVLPSTKEAFGRVLIEAMAMEKPTIASLTGGVTEIVDNQITGILVPPRDPDALTNAIIDLINDKDKAGRMGLAGRKRATEFFNVSSNAQKTMELYKELIG